MVPRPFLLSKVMEPSNTSTRSRRFFRPIPHLADADVLKAMQYDKKNEGGAFRFVLLRGIGEAEINCDVSEAEAQSALAQMYAYLSA